MSLEDEKASLEKEIESLDRHRHQLEFVLSAHTPRCTFSESSLNNRTFPNQCMLATCGSDNPQSLYGFTRRPTHVLDPEFTDDTYSTSNLTSIVSMRSVAYDLSRSAHHPSVYQEKAFVNCASRQQIRPGSLPGTGQRFESDTPYCEHSIDVNSLRQAGPTGCVQTTHDTIEATIMSPTTLMTL